MKDYSSNRETFVDQALTGSYAKLLPQAIAIADKELLLPPSQRVAWVTAAITVNTAPHISSVSHTVSSLKVNSTSGHSSTAGHNDNTVKNDIPGRKGVINITSSPDGSPVEDYEMVDSAKIRDAEVEVGGGISTAKQFHMNCRDNSPDSGEVISMDSIQNINLDVDSEETTFITASTTTVLRLGETCGTLEADNVSKTVHQKEGMPGGIFATAISSSTSSFKSSEYSDINALINEGTISRNLPSNSSSSDRDMSSAGNMISSIPRPHPQSFKKLDQTSLTDAASLFGTSSTSAPHFTSFSNNSTPSLSSSTFSSRSNTLSSFAELPPRPISSTSLMPSSAQSTGPGTIPRSPQFTSTLIVPPSRGETSSLFGALSAPAPAPSLPLLFLPLVAPPSACASPTIRRKNYSSPPISPTSSLTPVAPPVRRPSATSHDLIQLVKPPAPRYSPASSRTASTVTTPRIDSVAESKNLMSDSLIVAGYSESSLILKSAVDAMGQEETLPLSPPTFKEILKFPSNSSIYDDNDSSSSSSTFTGMSSSYEPGPRPGTGPKTQTQIHNNAARENINTVLMHSSAITHAESPVVNLFGVEHSQEECSVRNFAGSNVVMAESAAAAASLIDLRFRNADGNIDDNLSACESKRGGGLEGEGEEVREEELNILTQTEEIFNISSSSAVAKIDSITSEVAQVEIKKETDSHINAGNGNENILYEVIYSDSDVIISGDNEMYSEDQLSNIDLSSPSSAPSTISRVILSASSSPSPSLENSNKARASTGPVESRAEYAVPDLVAKFENIFQGSEKSSSSTQMPLSIGMRTVSSDPLVTVRSGSGSISPVPVVTVGSGSGSISPIPMGSEGLTSPSIIGNKLESESELKAESGIEVSKISSSAAAGSVSVPFLGRFQGKAPRVLGCTPFDNMPPSPSFPSSPSSVFPSPSSFPSYSSLTFPSHPSSTVSSTAAASTFTFTSQEIFSSSNLSTSSEKSSAMFGSGSGSASEYGSNMGQGSISRRGSGSGPSSGSGVGVFESPRSNNKTVIPSRGSSGVFDNDSTGGGRNLSSSKGNSGNRVMMGASSMFGSVPESAFSTTPPPSNNTASTSSKSSSSSFSSAAAASSLFAQSQEQGSGSGSGSGQSSFQNHSATVHHSNQSFFASATATATTAAHLSTRSLSPVPYSSITPPASRIGSSVGGGGRCDANDVFSSGPPSNEFPANYQTTHTIHAQPNNIPATYMEKTLNRGSDSELFSFVPPLSSNSTDSLQNIPYSESGPRNVPANSSSDIHNTTLNNTNLNFKSDKSPNRPNSTHLSIQNPDTLNSLSHPVQQGITNTSTLNSSLKNPSTISSNSTSQCLSSSSPIRQNRNKSNNNNGNNSPVSPVNSGLPPTAPGVRALPPPSQPKRTIPNAPLSHTQAPQRVPDGMMPTPHGYVPIKKAVSSASPVAGAVEIPEARPNRSDSRDFSSFHGQQQQQQPPSQQQQQQQQHHYQHPTHQVRHSTEEVAYESHLREAHSLSAPPDSASASAPVPPFSPPSSSPFPPMSAGTFNSFPTTTPTSMSTSTESTYSRVPVPALASASAYSPIPSRYGGSVANVYDSKQQLCSPRGFETGTEDIMQKMKDREREREKGRGKGRKNYGRPSCGVVAMGFGGRVAIMIPKGKKLLSPLLATPEDHARYVRYCTALYCTESSVVTVGMMR